MSIAAAIQGLHDVNPDAVRLAESVSFAMMIDRALLRAARLALSPPVDAGAEADLWFSALVQSRTSDGIVFHPEAADALRQRLTAGQVEEVWKLTSEQHAWLAPSLQLEEKIAYLSVSREPTANEDLAMCLRSVLAAMVSGERAGLAQWAVRALAMFPDRVQALPEARMLDTGTRLRLGNAIEAAEPLPPWMPWIAPPSLGTVSLELELRDGELEIRTTTQDLPVKVPKTNPLILEVAWEGQTRQVTFRDKVVVPVDSRELTLRTITGEEFDLHEARRGTSRLRDAVIDFSKEMARHREVRGREEEVEKILKRSENTSRIAVTGAMGTGKTAFLCELIREAERRGIATVGHFFRFGDLRLESIEAAERSLSAQIAVRFGMDERALELRLAEVVQRIPADQRLLIVIDDIDEARNAEREPVSYAVQEMLPNLYSYHPRDVCMIASATSLEVGASDYYVHKLRDLGNFAHDALVTRMAKFDLSAEIDEFRRLLELDDRAHMRAVVGVAAVALQPIQMPILNSSPATDALLRIEAHQFEIFNDVARRLVIEVLGDELTREAHRALVRRLEANLSIDAVDRYYLTNAVWHLVQAGDVKAASDLATDLDFMTAMIEKLGVRALIADFRLLDQPRFANALTDHASEIEESPQDLASILFTALLPREVTSDRLSLVPEVVRRVQLSPRRPQRHDGPIRGSLLVGDPNEPDAEPMLATWSDDGTVMLWPAGGDAPVRRFDVGASVTAFQVDWPYAITADARGLLNLWDLRDPSSSLTRVYAHDRAIDGMLLDPHTNIIATWSGSDPIGLWSHSHAGRGIVSYGELQGHVGAVTGCAFLSRGGLLLSASRDGTCRLWNLDSKGVTASAFLSAGAAGVASHWSSASRFVLTDGRRLDVVHLTAESTLVVSKPRFLSRGMPDLPISGLAVSLNRGLAATWSDDQTIRLWDVPMDSAPQWVLSAHRAAITACRFHPTKRWLISADADGIAIVWDHQSGEIVSRFDGHTRAIRTIEVDGDTIFTGGDEGIVMAWTVRKPENAELIQDFSKPIDRIEHCVVMPGEQLAVLTTGETTVAFGDAGNPESLPLTRPMLATSQNAALACNNADGLLIRFSHGPAERLAPPFFSEEGTSVPRLTACALSDDGVLAFAKNEVLFLQQEPHSFTYLGGYDAAITALAFAAHPILVGAFANGKVGVWEIGSNKLLHHLEAHRSRILALAAFENFAVTGAADGTLRIWDLRSGTARTFEAAHGGAITGLWMEGNIVVSASLDRTVRVFDYKLAKELAVCRGHRDRVTGVAIAMTDEVLYSCSDDRTIRQWDIESGAQKAIVYGTAPFRCISWRDGKLAAGDDAGNLWTVRGPAREESAEASIFISHSRDDSEFAERLTEDLLRDRIRSAPLSSASTVIVIASAALFDSTYARQEIHSAIEARTPVIVLLQGVNRFDVTRRWPELERFLSFKDTDWSDEARYERFVRQLSSAIREGPSPTRA